MKIIEININDFDFLVNMKKEEDMQHKINNYKCLKPLW